MSTEMEIRLARLEGAYEQVDRRLTDMSGRIDALSGRIDTLSGCVDALSDRIDRKFTAMYGLIVATWVTAILTILFRH